MLKTPSFTPRDNQPETKLHLLSNVAQHVDQFCHPDPPDIFSMYTVLFWHKINFVAFYALLCGAKIYPKILSVEQKWQISCMAMMMTLLSFSSLFIIIPNFIILKHLLCRPWCVASVPGAGAKHLVTPPNIPVATGQSLGPDTLDWHQYQHP